MKVKNVVLGAGIAGLACANKLRSLNEDYVLFEAESFGGGLCHSFNIKGFTFDSAVHLSFTEDCVARDFFDRTLYYRHQPVSYNYYQSQWIRHPLINNMHSLDVEFRADLIKSFVDRNIDITVESYGDWLKGSYGNLIAEKFYYLYTRKYWTMEPEDMSITWIGNRLNTPDLKRMLMGAFVDREQNDYYAKEMRYPKGNLGYQAFLLPLLKDVNIQYNKQVTELNMKKKYIKFSDNSLCCYENIYSSIPLINLVQITANVPKKILLASKKLKASKISLVSIGFNRPNIARWLWFYIYDEDILASRVNSPSMKSKQNVPLNCSSLQFEIYHSPDEKVDEHKIIENTRYALSKMKICNADDIAFMDYRLLPFGNVIFYKGMEADRDIIKDYYAQNEVNLIGRFGEWDYLWSDQSYLSGINAVRKS